MGMHTYRSQIWTFTKENVTKIQKAMEREILEIIKK